MKQLMMLGTDKEILGFFVAQTYLLRFDFFICNVKMFSWNILHLILWVSFSLWFYKIANDLKVEILL